MPQPFPPRITTEQRRKALSLVERALDAAETPSTPTSSLVNTAIRVARLVRDYASLTWLELEVRSVGLDEEKTDVQWELIRGLGDERARNILKAARDYYVEERALRVGASGPMDGKAKIQASPVAELERMIKNGNEVIPQLREGPSVELCLNLEAHESVLSRVRTRILRYLTRQERELGLSDDADALFDEYRAEVDLNLGRLCSDAMRKFSAACSAVNRREPEAATHALTSCRRLMKAVADELYPPSSEPVEGPDGKKYEVTDDKYVNRLVLWFCENHPQSRQRALLLDTLDDLRRRLKKLNDLTSKGVHADVAQQDVRFALVQTYLTMGEILRYAPPHDEID